MMYIVTPILYFSDFWNSKSFPVPIGSGLFNSSFEKFKVDEVLTKDNTLDTAKWEGAKPLLLTPFCECDDTSKANQTLTAVLSAVAIGYGLNVSETSFFSNALKLNKHVIISITVRDSHFDGQCQCCTARNELMLTFSFLLQVMHVFLWHRKDIKRALFYPQHEDVHNRLMMAYHNVPNSWYMTVLAMSLTGSIWLVAFHDSLQLPVWGLLLAVVVALVFLVPVGVLKAVSDTSIGLNVITE